MTMQFFLVLPFCLLLLMVATGPVLYPHFWHRFYPFIAIGLGVLMLFYYAMSDPSQIVVALAEYIQFIAYIAALYTASSGLLIKIYRRASASFNALFLVLGALLSNVIGTTGASMLLIRPFIRLNKGRIAPFHIVFFIFIVGNAGGALTPIGDPPLFLGFLKGVPFFWTLRHNFFPWLIALSSLVLLFFLWDLRTKCEETSALTENSIEIRGMHNLIWLAIIIISIFLDPHLVSWVPGIIYHGHTYSFIREMILIVVAGLSYRCADPIALQENDFSFEPIKEVVFIFFGIFTTMIPALTLVSHFASSEVGRSFVTPHLLYWATGGFSSILDNAPTYLTFLSAGMGAEGLHITVPADVVQYASLCPLYLQAIAVSSVFFGAMTYIGNGPNFMVKAIAEEQGVKMPSFGLYVMKYSLPLLLPVLSLVWLVFYFLPF